ncbi:CYTH domain-containing protein [Methylogaea oryzae]|uniref:CYTH domain-containing protein n=1 Tax=Methylogaea oryzae TaxID=1295382 RepID=A0A8D5AJU8_9GAMM|nr:CYTH domain-containing protein [Methylogaea oryzae]BBL71174.1 CYTH domain-containing protein [Methylogaea oryzae]
MAIEIEKKFLLADERWRAEVTESAPMRQGYLNREQRCSVRVRTSGKQAWLNIKSATIGAQRQEFEYEIPLEDADCMLDTLSHQPLIEKVRHYVPYQGHLWEIDEFAGDNAGLIVAEIELSHPDEHFARPDWLGQEVTMDVRYYNTSLSRHPYRNWEDGKEGLA